MKPAGQTIAIVFAALWTVSACALWTLFLFAADRSSQWPTVRRAHLEREPACVACGGDRDVQVHHVIPIGVDPSLELSAENLITLCRRDHLTFGHFGNFERHNPKVRQHAEIYRGWKDEE